MMQVGVVRASSWMEPFPCVQAIVGIHLGKKYFLGIIIYFLGINQIQESDLRNCIYLHYSIVVDSLFIPAMAPSVDC
jgi:hypothetical protein